MNFRRAVLPVLAFLAMFFLSNRMAFAEEVREGNEFSLEIMMPEPTCSNEKNTKSVRETLAAACELIGESLLVGRGPWGLGIFDSFSCKANDKSREQASNWVLEVTSSSDGILFRMLHRPMKNSKKLFLQAQVLLPGTSSILSHLSDKTFVRYLAGAIIDQLPLHGKIIEDRTIPEKDPVMKYVKMSLESKAWMRVDLVGFDASRGYWDLEPKTGREGTWIVSRGGRGQKEKEFRNALSRLLFREIKEQIGVGEDAPAAQGKVSEANWNKCRTPEIPAAVTVVDSSAERAMQVSLRSRWAPPVSLTGQESGFGEQLEVFPSVGRFSGLVVRGDFALEKHKISLHLSRSRTKEVSVERQHMSFEIGWRAFFSLSSIEFYLIPGAGYTLETMDSPSFGGSSPKIQQSVFPSILVDGGTRLTFGSVISDIGGGITFGPRNGSDFLSLRIRSEVLYRFPPRTLIDFADVAVSGIFQDESLQIGESDESKGEMTRASLKVTSTTIGLGLHLFLK